MKVRLCSSMKMIDMSTKRRVCVLVSLTTVIYLAIVWSDHLHERMTLDEKAGEATARPMSTSTTDDMSHQEPVWNEKIGNWISRRKGLLSSDGPKKVLFFTYMRGGSSFGGQLFNQDKNTTYWYEPTAAYYTAHYGISVVSLPQRIIYSMDRNTQIAFPFSEQSRLVQYVDNLLTCQYERVPVLAWLHPFIDFSSSPVMQALRTCISANAGAPIPKLVEDKCGPLPYECFYSESSLSNGCPLIHLEARRLISMNTSSEEVLQNLNQLIHENEEIPNEMTEKSQRIADFEKCVADLGERCEPCMIDAKHICATSNVQAARMSRIKMDDVDNLLAAIPDLHVVYYVRDPRAIVASRANQEGLMVDHQNKSKLVELELLCRRMKEDIRVKQELETKYPEAFLQVRYEDLVMEPLATAQTVYDFIGTEVSEDWQTFAQTSQDEENMSFSHGRASISKWKLNFPEGDLDIIRTYCAEVLEDLGY